MSLAAGLSDLSDPPVADPPPVRIQSLHVYPLKSAAGLSVPRAQVDDTGLLHDRIWMVVDARGEMLTQREHPRLALVQPRVGLDDVVLRAPGMLALHLRLDRVETATRVRVWDDVVRAYDMGGLAAQWISDFLAPGKQPGLRLVRFDPKERRLSDFRWTRGQEAANAFSDGYPLLVTSVASLQALNERLQQRGQPPVTMARFRPNLVLDGLEAFDEDHLDTLSVDTPEGPVSLRLVKPCQRCSVPNVDPDQGVLGREPGATLAQFRADARLGGGISFGMNAIVRRGVGCWLAAGQPVQPGWAFDAPAEHLG